MNARGIAALAALVLAAAAPARADFGAPPVADRAGRDPQALALYEEAYALVTEGSDLARFDAEAERGLALAERAAALDPGFAEAWALVMRGYFNKGSVALQATRSREKSFGLCVGGVFSRARTADVPEFRAAYEAAAKAHFARPEDPALHMHYAYAAGVAGAPLAAGGREAWAREMKAILARSPGFVPALQGYAEAMDDLGRSEEAEAAWTSILARPDAGEAKKRAAARLASGSPAGRAGGGANKPAPAER